MTPGHFAPDRLRVLDLQRAGAPEPVRMPLAVMLPEKIRITFSPRLGDLRFDLRLGAVADADHRDDRADADDDAERGQDRAQLVPAQARGRRS